MSNQNSNAKFIIGIILILIGAVLSLNIFIIIFTAPIFLIGAVLVLLSKKSILTKSLTIILPIILWWVVFKYGIEYYFDNKPKISVVVPDQFQGQIRIVYNEAGGIDPVQKDGVMELKVPDNGVLVLKPFIPASQSDIINFNFVNTSGQTMTLASINDKGSAANKPPVVLFEGIGSGSTLDYNYASFYIVKSEADQTVATSDILSDSLVKVSRGGK